MRALMFIIVFLVSIRCTPFPETENSIAQNLSRSSSSIPRQDDAWDVYWSIISFSKDRLRPDINCVLDETTYGSVSPESSLEEVVNYLRLRIAAVEKNELLDDFANINKNPSIIAFGDTKEFGFKIVSRAMVRQMEDNLSSTCGLIQFSNIGFNKERSLALVYVGVQNETRNGSGRYFVVRFVEGNWVIVQQIPAWNS